MSKTLREKWNGRKRQRDSRKSWRNRKLLPGDGCLVIQVGHVTSYILLIIIDTSICLAAWVCIPNFNLKISISILLHDVVIWNFLTLMLHNAKCMRSVQALIVIIHTRNSGKWECYCCIITPVLSVKRKLFLSPPSHSKRHQVYMLLFCTITHAFLF